MDITVIIPTYNRPDFLKSALDRCAEQTLLPNEIIIGDDSKLDSTETWINVHKENYPFKIKYQRNKPSFGQAKNVDTLISYVDTPLFILLHDDDLFLENCLYDLYQEFINNDSIDVVFGKQYLMNDNGEILKDKSVDFNLSYSRTSKNAGINLNPMSVTLKQMLPSNSYLMKTDIAKKLGYGDPRVAGTSVDFHFSLKLSEANVCFRYINKYVSCYRMSTVSVSSNSNDEAGYYSFKLIENKKMNNSITNKERKDFLIKKSPIAVYQAILIGKLKDAYNIYFSEFHRPHIASLGGIRRFLLILKLGFKLFIGSVK